MRDNPATPAVPDQARPTGVHEIRWTIDGVCAWPTAQIICHAEPDDDCRTWCAEGCEEYCPGGHRRERQQYCNVREWLDSDGPGDCYEGPETTLTNGPIVPVWDDCHYVWHYAPRPHMTSLLVFPPGTDPALMDETQARFDAAVSS